MLEKTSTSVKFLAFYTASKQGSTGLTVTVDVYDPSGTKIVDASAATELAGGLYTYTLSSSNSSAGEYVAIFKTTDSAVDAQHIPSLWSLGRAGVENLDAAVSSRSTLTVAQVNAEADTALADVGLTSTITGLPTTPHQPPRPPWQTSAPNSPPNSRISTQAVSTRATPADIPTADITAVKAKTDLLNTDRLANVATTNIVGTLLAQANS
jgi:hypothetical protein